MHTISKHIFEIRILNYLENSKIFFVVPIKKIRLLHILIE